MSPGSINAFLRGPQFRRELPLEGAREVVRWWEKRRFFFNLVVGCSGVVTCVLLVVCAFSADSVVGEAIGMPDGPLLGVFCILLYGLLANVFYTGGWVCELAVKATTTSKASNAFALQSFRVGVAFSICMTLLPAIVCWIAFAAAVLHGQKHGYLGE